jgi:hypothetical protein
VNVWSSSLPKWNCEQECEDGNQVLCNGSEQGGCQPQSCQKQLLRTYDPAPPPRTECHFLILFPHSRSRHQLHKIRHTCAVETANHHRLQNLNVQNRSFNNIRMNAWSAAVVLNFFWRRKECSEMLTLWVLADWIYIALKMSVGASSLCSTSTPNPKSDEQGELSSTSSVHISTSYWIHRGGSEQTTCILQTNLTHEIVFWKLYCER